MSQWHVLRTRASRERDARNRVEALGLEAWCPMMEVWRRPSRHARYRDKVRKEIALFPRYLFVGAGRGVPVSFYDLATIPAIIGWIALHGTPSVVPGHVIEAMKERFGNVMSATMENNGKDRLKVGDKVRVVSGFLQGPKVLEVVKVKGSAVQVSMPLLGAENVSIGVEYLERVE